MINNIYDLIKEDEGFKQFAYDDATGLPVKAPIGKLTIGYGWNIQDVGIDQDFAEKKLQFTVDYVKDKLQSSLDFFNKLNDARQAVLINVAFNVGVEGLLKFKKTLNYIAQESYILASQELLDSSCAKQLKNRYNRLANMLQTGKWE